MKQAIKNILKRLPIIKQYLMRMSNLEGSLRFEINKSKTEIAKLKAEIELLNKKSENNQKKISDEINTTKHNINNSMEGVLKLLNDIRTTQNSLNGTISAVDKKVKRELQIQKNKNQWFDEEIKDIRRDVVYRYYKGLHPDCYEENIKEWYHFYLGEELNLDNPRTYTQKMQWLKLYDITPEKTRLADKYAVRDWVKEKIGEEYLIPLLGVWHHFEDIDFNKLPDRFVLKANHGSGYNIIIKDKNNFDKALAEKKFKKWLNTNFAFVNGIELQYKNIRPLIIAEKYMEEMNSLNDYKFMCFDGKVSFIWVDIDRFTNHKRAVYTTDWERIGVQITYPLAEEDIPKPDGLDEMLKIAEKLSAGFCHVRVDLYNVDGKIYFGEMTFSSESGRTIFTPKEFDLKVGEMLTLPQKQSG